MSETLSNTDFELENSALGKKTSYPCYYSPELLFRLPRKNKRTELGIEDDLPFKGIDVWNAFEVSWLNTNGKPIAALASIVVPCESPNLFESKSLKLYLNSLSQSRFESKELVGDIISRDLSQVVEMPVTVNIDLLNELTKMELSNYSSFCIDSLDISIDSYDLNPDFLSIENNEITEETIHSNLLKSNCLITGQPDWGSIEISYRGKKIQLEGLLRYVISFRNHHEFHEQCVERVFMDIMRRCQPEKLTVEARYTRRGGIDINPFRTTENDLTPPNLRLFRQ